MGVQALPTPSPLCTSLGCLHSGEVTLLAAHRDPHGAPLRDVDRLDDPRDGVAEADGTRRVVDHVGVANLRASSGSESYMSLDGIAGSHMTPPCASLA